MIRHMRQQVDETHRAGRLSGRKRDRPTAAGIDLKVGKFGEDARNRFFQRNLALLDQLHESDRCDGLGHAGDTEQGVIAQFALVVSHRT